MRVYNLKMTLNFFLKYASIGNSGADVQWRGHGRAATAGFPALSLLAAPDGTVKDLTPSTGWSMAPPRLFSLVWPLLSPPFRHSTRKTP